MIFWNAFINSIKLPNKQAMFQLNRIGLDIAIFYILFLLFFTSIPSFIDRLANASQDMNVIFTLIYFFIFYYLPLSIIVFIVIFITAYLGKLISILAKRKLHYSLLWKMTAFTATVPFLLYTIIALFIDVNNSYLLLTFLYSITLLAIMVMHYPKRRDTNHKKGKTSYQK